MIMGVTTSIILDTRRAKKGRKYPVRLSVIADRKVVPYQTVFDITETDFEKLSKTRITAEARELSSALQDLKLQADLFIKEMGEFSFPAFEFGFVCKNAAFKNREKYEVMPSLKVDSETQFDFTTYEKRFTLFREDHTVPGTISRGYLDYIKVLLEKECIGSAFTYQDSYNSIKKYRGNIRFKHITPAFLYGYEKWMLNRGCSLATVGIKLRPLRAIFNQAIADKVVSRDLYPFGPKKYEVPSTTKRKLALSKVDIGAIFRYEPGTSERRMAKAYWIFSYLGNGMNLRDVINLKVKDYQHNMITFVREKTKRTSRKELRTITVVVSAQMEKIINEYGNPAGKPNDYLFPVLNSALTPMEIFTGTKKFIKYVDDNMKKIGVELGLKLKLTSIVARHSFSTILKRSGYSTELIMEALGHSEPTITSHYLDSFETDVKIRASEDLIPD